MATSSISDKDTIAHSAIVFGPNLAIDQRQIEEAINNIKNKIDIDHEFCSFHISDIQGHRSNKRYKI